MASLIIIDSSVENYHSLLSGLAIAADVLILDNKLDGVEQITGVLREKTYNTVHIVAHGLPGCLALGSSQLSLHSLSYYAQQVRGWFTGLSSTSTLLLYGCNVAQGDAGEEFITKLQQLTGVEIAASQTQTGNAAKGGNWELEYRTGEVELQLAFQPEVMQEYQGILAITAGNITIDASELILKRRDGSSITTGDTGGRSVGGNITIDARGIFLLNPNEPPSVTDIRKRQDEDTAIVFATANFIDAFNDADGDSLSKIQITALPDNGTLKLGDTAVTLDQEIEAAELDNLTFTPVTDFTGNTSFGWNGSDGTVYANQPAKVDLNIQPLFRLSQSGGVFQSNKSATAQIQVRWLQSPARNYEFGFIAVDDANGGLDLDGDGIIDLNPDEPNYQTAVLSRKQVIFNGNQSNSSNVLTRENAQGDFMVSEGESITQLQSATLITGFNIFYLSDGTQTSFSTDNNSQSIAVSEGTGYNQLQFADSQGETVSFEISPTPVLVTPGNSTNQVQAEISLSRIADFQNTIGVYAVDELTGGIDTNGDGMIDFKPGDVGYSQAAVERAITLSAPTNGGTSSTTVDLQGGQVLGLFLIADADISNFLSQNPDNRVDGGPLAYFSFTPANPDGEIHIMQLGSGDTNIFGFEDLLGGGDGDFNDIIASVTYTNSV